MGFTAEETHKTEVFHFIVLNKLTGAITVRSATFQPFISTSGLNGQFEYRLKEIFIGH